MGMGQNLAKGIPPKMRAIIALTVVIMVVGVVVGVKLFSNSSAAGPEASAKVDAVPEGMQGSNAPGEAPVIPEDSPMGQELAKDRERQLAEAQAGKASFMDKFEDAHTADQAKRQEDAFLEGQKAPVQTGIDDVMEQKRREEERRREIAAMQGNYGAGGGAISGGYDTLVADEVKRYEDRDNEIKAKVDAMKASRTSLPVAATEFGTSGSRSGSGSESDGTERAASRAPRSTLERFDAAADEDAPVASSSSKPVNRAQRVNAGDVYYSILVTPVNSDEVSPIWAIVAQEGKLKNARALGSFQRSGEKVVMQFNNLTVNGRDCQISAVAIDPDPNSYRTAIADSVDRHTFSRYSMLMAAAFVEGYADALASTTTTVNPTGGSTTQSNPLPDAGDRALVATGKVGQVLVPKMEKAFERPPTVEVNGRRQLGLLFLSPLDLSSCK